MNLAELKKAVDQAIEHAKECGDETPEEIQVSLQIDGPGPESIYSGENVELIYDNNLQASGCVLMAIKVCKNCHGSGQVHAPDGWAICGCNAKTKPCPACGKDLILPGEYFDAISKLNQEAGKFCDVAVLDYRVNDLNPALEIMRDVLEGVIGDTEPQLDEDITDEEIRMEYPVFWVAQELSGLIKKDT